MCHWTLTCWPYLGGWPTVDANDDILSNGGRGLIPTIQRADNNLSIMSSKSRITALLQILNIRNIWPVINNNNLMCWWLCSIQNSLDEIALNDELANGKMQFDLNLCQSKVFSNLD